MWKRLSLYLPSSPTRRSSDLPVRRVQPARPARRAQVDLLEQPELTAPCRVRQAPRARRARPAQLVPRVLTARDRKSTRLNSSHLVISYAVLCLKKKTKNLIRI